MSLRNRAFSIAIIVTLGLCGLPRLSLAANQCQEFILQTPYDEAKLLTSRWAQSVMSGDLNLIMANYSPRAILAPTFSLEVRTDHEGIKQYFTGLLEKNPRVEFNADSSIEIKGPLYAIQTGTYAFIFPDGRVVNARYKFVFIKTNIGWLIVKHISSQI